VDTGGESANPAQASVSGLGLGLSLDHPDRWGGSVDLPATADRDASAALFAVLAAPGDEDQFALRDGRVLVRRMVRAPRPEGSRAWRPVGTTLITGGLGGLGVHLARMLADRGADHLVLTSRRGIDTAGAVELVEELEALGTKVTVAACDVADREQVRELLDRIPAPGAVFHAAGVSQRIAPLADLTTEEIAETHRAKTLGAAHLDELLAHQPLTAFVLFSSGTAVWGSTGQTAYGSANAYLDALAARRRAAGRTATSVAWGSWAGGMVNAEISAVMCRIGAPPMAPAKALTALRQALDHDEQTLVVADIDWSRFTPTYTLTRPRTLLNALGQADDGGQTGPVAVAAVVDKLGAMSEAEQGRALLDLVRTEVAGVLGYDDPGSVDPVRAFDDLGFDSVSAVELRGRLGAAVGRTLPATVVFDYATPEALAGHLRAELCAAGGGDREPGLTELTQLESVAATLRPEDIRRHQMTTRLRALLAHLSEVTAEGTDVQERLADASADDVLDFIDKELGLA
jgi:NAD(P)-dependent dehydrogenase (short-subunit alcohol dehydrogenase family)/acyl carrier protein